MAHRETQRQIGQLVLAGFRGESLPVELRALAREFSLGGVIVQDHNITEPDQVVDLARQAQELTPIAPPWVTTAPGSGQALARQGLTAWPTWSALGRADDLSLTARFGRALARERRALGISFAFTPSLDLSDDALGTDPERVTRHVVAVLEALHAEGLPGCAPSFPGLGRARSNGDDARYVEEPPDHLQRVDWAPFRSATAAGLDAVLLTHVLVTSVDDREIASRSHSVVEGGLRDVVDFNGVAISEDLAAIPAVRQLPDGASAVAAIKAGCDGVWMGDSDMDALAAVLEALVRAVEDDSLPITRVDTAVRRQMRLKVRYLSDDVRRAAPRPPTLRDVLASAEHALVAEQMRQFV